MWVCRCVGFVPTHHCTHPLLWWEYPSCSICKPSLLQDLCLSLSLLHLQVCLELTKSNRLPSYSQLSVSVGSTTMESTPNRQKMYKEILIIEFVLSSVSLNNIIEQSHTWQSYGFHTMRSSQMMESREEEHAQRLSKHHAVSCKRLEHLQICTQRCSRHQLYMNTKERLWFSSPSNSHHPAHIVRKQ